MAAPERLAGIDLARFVALAGMMAAHLTLLGDQAGPVAVALIDGPPSTLFAVLGGVSVVLASRARLAAGETGAAIRAMLVRGAAILVLGVLLQAVAWGVYVVLAPFGIAIALCALLLRAPTWLLAAMATVLAVVGGTLLVRAREAFGFEPGVVADVLVTGVYPVVTWFGYLLIGMVVGRALIAGRERLALVGVGVAGALLLVLGLSLSALGMRLVAAQLGYDDPAVARDEILANGYGAAQGTDIAWQLVAAPHTGTPADIARTIGMALLVIAVLGLLARLLPRPALRLLEPIRAAGAAPLTIYAGHVVLITLSTIFLLGTAPQLALGWGAWALHIGLAIATGLALALLHARGPLERLVGMLADAAAERRAPALVD